MSKLLLLAEHSYSLMESRANKSRTDEADSRLTWTVWRQGEDGNPFQMACGLSQADARQMIEEFEARGHKQTYWRERETDE